MAELTPDQEIQLMQGLQAEALLTTDFFNGVINGLLDRHTKFILNSSPEDTKERERAYFCIKGLKDILTELEEMVALKEQVEHALRQDTEETD